MSKPRRRVTVDTGKSGSEESEKRKPSVFERLGPGGVQRKYEERGDKSKTSSSQSLYLDKCRNWLLTGDCPFGPKCKFQHGPFIAKRGTKNRSDDEASDDLRLKVKGGSERRKSAAAESPESRARSRHEKEAKIKSTVVVKNTTGLDSDEENSENSDNWDEEVLDYKKELELEKKRQELQRELSQLSDGDADERENITIEKKLSKPARESVSFSIKKNRQLTSQTFPSEDSLSDSSPERGKSSPKKSLKKMSPGSKKKGDKKKHKQKSPVRVGPSKSFRSPSPEPVKKKEHKKKYDTEDDSPPKVKHKKAKKMEKKQHDRSPGSDLPKPKKKHSPRIDKFFPEKLSKSDRKAFSPDLGSPSGKRSHKSWSPASRSRSRSRSITPSPTKKQKIISPPLPGKKVKGEKVKQKKKKGKGKLGDGAKVRRVSPVRIKKKKVKPVVPFEIKRDIEEDLPARHSDSPGSENMPRSLTPDFPRKKAEQPEREFFKGLGDRIERGERESGGRDVRNRKTKRKRSESPAQSESAPPGRGDHGKKRAKGGQSQEYKLNRKDLHGRGEPDRQKLSSDDRSRRRSPDSFRSEDRSPTPIPSERRTRSPEDPPRSRPRMNRDEEHEVSRSRDRHSPDERRPGRESRNRRDDVEGRGQRTSTEREGYRSRYDEHRHDPRERFEEGFQEFPDRFPERTRYADEREQLDPRDRHRQDHSFDRARDSRRDRFDSRDRFSQDQGRVLPDREFIGDHHQQPMRGRGRGRVPGGYTGSMRDRNYGSERPELVRGYPEYDRQSRRSEWEDHRRGVDLFPQGPEWDRHDMRRELSADDRFDVRRDDHRFDDRAAFGRDDERVMGRDGRVIGRGSHARSLDRNMRDNWRDRQDMRDDRMAVRDDRMRDDRMDSRRRDRHSPSPFDKRGYQDDRFPRDERMFDDDRIREGMDRGRADRMRDDRSMRGGMERGRGMMDMDRGMMQRGRDERQLDRGRDGSLDERGRRERGRDDRGMDRGRDDRGAERMRDERESLERGDDRGFPDDRRRDRGFREDRDETWGGREERGFRDEEESRFVDERAPRDERGGKFERESRDRRRDDFRDPGSREPSAEKERTPDRRSRDSKLERDDQEKMSRDGSPKDEHPRSSRSDRSREKGSKDDKDSEKSHRDSKAKDDDKSVKSDKDKGEKITDEKSKERKRDDKLRRKGEKSPKKEEKKEEKPKWPPKVSEEAEAGSGDDARSDATPNKDLRKRINEKGEPPVSPIPKRLRDVSPASSSRSRSSRSSRRDRSKDQPRPRHHADSGSEKEDRPSRAKSQDRDRKPRKKESSRSKDSQKTEKSRSVSPKPTKETLEEKVEGKPKVRQRSVSVSSSKSQEPVPLETGDISAVDLEKRVEDGMDDEEIFSAVGSITGKSSLADEKGSDRLSIRSVQFSDWSEDDLADNILNQDVEAEKEGRGSRSPSRSSRGSRTSEKKVADVQEKPLDPVPERSEPDVCAGGDNEDQLNQGKDGMSEEDMDAFPEYEQISSDEEGFMEEEAEKQSSIINILDIDWASLKETKPPKPKGSVLERFSAASIFSQIGVSRAYAGDELFEKIQSICQKQLNDEAQKEKEAGSGVEKAEKPAKKFSLLDPVAAFHCSALRKLKERANLLKNIGSHRRALCARKDLEIRRRLCKVDKVFDQSPVYPSQTMETDLSKLSIQLFRQGRDRTPEQKEDGKSEIACL